MSKKFVLGLALSLLVPTIVVAMGSGARTRVVPPANISGTSITPTTVTSTTVNASTVNATFVDAGVEWLHGALELSSTSGSGVNGCFLNPNQDSNYLYFQGCNLRTANNWYLAGTTTVAGTGASLKLTDESSYTAIVDHPTKPTVTACSGGTAATMTAAAGTAAFQFDVGTACASENTATLTMPAASTGWACSCSSTTADRMVVQRTMPSASTTSVVLQNIVISTGAQGDWTDSADVSCMCRGL